MENDISVLDRSIGRQVSTDFGGAIDLLCLDSAGNTVVVELKRGLTPREVTAQALDYASWVKGLSSKELMDKATEYFKNPDSLASVQNRFGEELPGELNLGHRALVVAEVRMPSAEVCPMLEIAVQVKEDIQKYARSLSDKQYSDMRN